MDYALGFPGKYITAAEIVGKTPTVTIERAVLEPVVNPQTGKEGTRLVLYIEGEERGWVMNKTNCKILEGLFKSRDTEQWVGHQITVAAEKVSLGTTVTDGIRIVGSPELTEPMTVSWQHPRKKKESRVLKPTGTR